MSYRTIPCAVVPEEIICIMAVTPNSNFPSLEYPTDIFYLLKNILTFVSASSHVLGNTNVFNLKSIKMMKLLENSRLFK